MKNILRVILYKPVNWAAKKFASRPVREKIFSALDALYAEILKNPGKRGLVIPFDPVNDRFIIFSDQHKGCRDGADDFAGAEKNYLSALDYYNANNFSYISLGDSEELWENGIRSIKKHNQEVFDREKKFLKRKRFIKVFGNHDLFWDNDPLAAWHLKEIYGEKLRVYEGLILIPSGGAVDYRLPTTDYRLLSGGAVDYRLPTTDLSSVASAKEDCQLPTANCQLFLTHGHQGDAQSDGNWFSKFFIANIWAPLQAYLRINPNTPAYDAEKKTLHNRFMYEWSAEKNNPWLITGHTHQPVFASLTHLERLFKQFQEALNKNDKEGEETLRKEIRLREREFTTVSMDYMNMKPSYFNTGCCCFSDGDITGIELADGEIRLVKWSEGRGREVLEKMKVYS
jgi:UDP-2,3-diacylglucosamine pyrophosphatase LpxH